MYEPVVNHDGDAVDLVATSPQKTEETREFLKVVESAKGDSPQYEGIAILGSHPATVEKAPFEDGKWLIYACSPHNVEQRTLPRVDQWFELHTPIADETRAYPYLRTVENMPFVWMRDQQSIGLFPGAHPYPEKEMFHVFGPFFFTSSIAYMLAKAIMDCEHSGIKQIGIWGVMQASKTEYAYQRPGIQYFIWQAAVRGIKVYAPRESRLFDPPGDKW